MILLFLRTSSQPLNISSKEKSYSKYVAAGVLAARFTLSPGMTSSVAGYHHLYPCTGLSPTNIFPMDASVWPCISYNSSTTVYTSE